MPVYGSAAKIAERKRRIRLVVRTQPSQGWCTGSIPVCAATLSLGLVVLIALGSCRPLFNREVSGAVLSITGTANGTIEGKTNRLTNGSRIELGERIVTAKGSRTDLMLLPGLLIELEEETEIEITQLYFSKDGNELIDTPELRKARLALSRGALLASVRRGRTRTQLFVETKAGVLSGGSGRTFRIETSGNKTRVMCVRRRTSFQAAKGGAPVKIGAGYFEEWPTGAAGPQPAAEAGPQAQTEVTKILEAEKQLRLLERQQRSAFTPWRRW